MRSTVLVTGGTGVVGSRVVLRLLEAGSDVRVLSRRAGADVPADVRLVTGDLATGDGVSEAVDGVDAVVHCASATGSPVYARAKQVDVRGTQRLLGVLPPHVHLVYVSIVGIDRIPLGYYRAKLETERAIEASGVAHTILRTTQFHTLLARTIRAATRMPVGVVPKGFLFQPVDPGEVAERLVSFLAGSPLGRAPDMGGPQVRTLVDLALAYLRAAGVRKPVVAMWTPGRVARAFREGRNCAPDHATGRITWEEWLAARSG